MARLSRDKKRDHQRPAAPEAAPIDVHVPASGPGAGGASVGGVRVVPASGQEIQHAVLNHLHRIAAAGGHTVLATVHDDRIGYVVPLRVNPDGSSDYAAEPTRVAPAGERGVPGTPGGPGGPTGPEAPVPGAARGSEVPGIPGEPRGSGALGMRGSTGAGMRTGTGAGTTGVPGGVPGSAAERAGGPVPVPAPGPPPVWPDAAASHEPEEPARLAPTGGPQVSGRPEGPGPAGPAAPFGTPAAPGVPAASRAVRPQWARYDQSTHVLREVPEPARDAESTFSVRALPDEASSGAEAAPTSTPRALPEPRPAQAHAQAPASTPAPASSSSPAPGTVAAPTGVFGPPPVMDTRTAPLSASAPDRGPMQAPAPAPPSPPARTTPSRMSPFLGPAPDDDLDPAPKPAPPRGFDAVAEAVLGDGHLTAPGDDTTPALLAEPVARITEAVNAGRTDTASELAERTVAQASQSLGPEHPEVLRLRELTAYVAYLADDPVRSFHLSLDLAGVHHRTRDADAAYASLQSAVTAWRAVRDPHQGLDLGQALIARWTELTAEDGPAVDDIEQLEKARVRMGRLADRARASD
ncbi:tetratricopeptide repeat protein [Streptomyces sp. ALI-76-A]|uniref:tetratricopeptide repeat protein n=1 Tax=Streptomyces sp. ALI-76-A TaxID=3025736 RepID=UPI00256EA661|nr:tetratricopeptide repeat protein [Streptomyces sp. ALI-76-A]MDL5203154.1 tetratricopeptide repeat protein [Streptomyces sp. ALI-76-A]